MTIRLALQYGLSDAVIIGSKSVTKDGAVSNTSSGYIWQSYEVCNWGHLKEADPELLSHIKEQRIERQRQGDLSKREYPAQIVVTWSGKQKDTQHDFLAARIFHERLPNGKHMETYIITSEIGAQNILKRSHLFDLQDRIKDMLIILPPMTRHITPTASSTNRSNDTDTYRDNDTESDMSGDGAPLSGLMDISLLPKLLFDKYDIRIANHDGGRYVLRSFARAGAISQVNLTLCEGQSVVDVLRTGPYVDEIAADLAEYQDPLLEPKLSYFFHSGNEGLFANEPNDSACTTASIHSVESGDVPLTQNSSNSSASSDVSECGSSSSSGRGGVCNYSGGGHSIPRSWEVVEVTKGVFDRVMAVTFKVPQKFDF